MSIKSNLKSHFESLGYRFDWAPPRIHKELRKLMGRERHEYLMDQGDVIGTPAQEVSLYSLPKNLREAATLFSLDGSAALTTSSHMASVLNSYLRPGMKVGDMGCGIGALISWLSAQHPTVQFEGIEVAENLVKAASERFQSDNLSIVCRDYETLLQEVQPFDIIFSIFGMETAVASFGAHFALDIDNMRESSGHNELVAAFSSVLGSWRKVVREGARLLMFVRAGSAQSLLAIVDAAELSGWGWHIDSSSIEGIRQVTGSDVLVEKIPFLTLEAKFANSESRVFSAVDVFSWYSSQLGDSMGEAETIEGARAMILTRELLKGADIQWKAKKDYDDGHTMQALIINDLEITYLIRRATTGYCTVSPVSGSEAEAKIQSFKNDPFNEAEREFLSLFEGGF